MLILAAITASLLGANRRKRRPVLLGALAGLGVSIVTFLLATTLLDSLQRYGERLEAIVGLVAIAVLLLVMNWFFHRVYWTEWISSFHKRRRALLARDEDARVAFFSAQVLGLFLLGLTSVYREGFETTLFLQSLSSRPACADGGRRAARARGDRRSSPCITFRLQRKLPYKRMLIVTGVLLAFVLVVMVGATVRTMQGAGWLPIHSIDVDAPVLARAPGSACSRPGRRSARRCVALVFVIGSYFAAEYVRDQAPAAAGGAAGRRRPARRARPRRPSRSASSSAAGARPSRLVAAERARAVGPGKRLAVERAGRRDQRDVAEGDAEAVRVRACGAARRGAGGEELGGGAGEREPGWAHGLAALAGGEAAQRGRGHQVAGAVVERLRREHPGRPVGARRMPPRSRSRPGPASRSRAAPPTARRAPGAERTRTRCGMALGEPEAVERPGR